MLEDGLKFAVDLAHGQKGGLFLDQRENRARVGVLAKGKSVLNLFGYTGGFSLHAAKGGATRTDTVDVAGPAIEAARRNFELNDLPATNAGFYTEDAFAFLEGASKRGDTWDIVVSRPAQLCATPGRRARCPSRLHQAAPSGGSRHGARRPALRRVLQQPHRAGRLPADDCGRRTGCRASLAPRINARRGVRPPGA